MAAVPPVCDTGGRAEAVWQEVDDRANTKLPEQYDLAVSLLADL